MKQKELTKTFIMISSLKTPFVSISYIKIYQRCEGNSLLNHVVTVSMAQLSIHCPMLAILVIFPLVVNLLNPYTYNPSRTRVKRNCYILGCCQKTSSRRRSKNEA